MTNLQYLYGFLIGLLSTIAGSCLFLWLFTDANFMNGIDILRANGQLGNLLKLGAILNLAVFYGLLKYQKDKMAWGIIIAIVVLTIMTFFI